MVEAFLFLALYETDASLHQMLGNVRSYRTYKSESVGEGCPYMEEIPFLGADTVFLA